MIAGRMILLSTKSLHSSLSSDVCCWTSGSRTLILFSSSKCRPARERASSAIFLGMRKQISHLIFVYYIFAYLYLLPAHLSNNQSSKSLIFFTIEMHKYAHVFNLAALLLLSSYSETRTSRPKPSRDNSLHFSLILRTFMD